jgi:rubredoxin
MMSKLLLFAVALVVASPSWAFTIPQSAAGRTLRGARPSRISLFMANEQQRPSLEVIDDPTSDPMEFALSELEDEAVRKAKRAQELREQEVFMKKSTGVHRCTNCDWQYDETKGDSMMIGGTIKPGTKFEALPPDWRCPVCRASKDAFAEVVEEIPGFEVNQGYGFGTNSWTAGQKNLAIFGGLGFFFLLFLSGYALS